MKTKQVIPAGTLQTTMGDKYYITDVKPLSRKDWMTPSQQMWNVIPFMPTGKHDPATNHWIYLPERTIICNNPEICYWMHDPIAVTVFEYHDNECVLAEQKAGYDKMLEEIGAEPSEDAMLQGEGHE